MEVESHPFSPFLPKGAKLLMLGTFPPSEKRWSMPFYYPNWINDFWRVMGLIFFDDKHYFEVKGEKRFDKERIISFAFAQRLAFFDTATKVQRLKDNASDNYLEILEPTDIGGLLGQMRDCRRLITTGGKASEELRRLLSIASGRDVDHPLELPAIGSSVKIHVFDRDLEWFRMPSTSRAYPLALEKKAMFYRRLFE